MIMYNVPAHWDLDFFIKQIMSSLNLMCFGFVCIVYMKNSNEQLEDNWVEALLGIWAGHMQVLFG